MAEEFYRPIILEKKDLELDGTDYNPDLNMLKEGNTIRVQLDQDVVIQRISHEIYSNFKSGIRELLNNEYRACRQARKLYNAKPKVIITVNKDERLLSIEGVDSLGISVRIFDKVLRTLGVSGNIDGGGEIGMFGMGFASYTTLSELVIVETFAREDNQQYSFMGDRGIDFKILPKPDRDTYGTKLTLTYKDSIQGDNIIDKIINCAKLSTIATTINVISLTGSSYDKYHTSVIECPVYDSGKDMVMDSFKNNVEEYDPRIVWYKEIHIDTEDIEFFGIIYAQGKEYSTFGKRSVTKTYLVNTPIDMSFTNLIPFVFSYLNIKNERKFMPTADRDRMKDESSEKIQEIFANELQPHFVGCGINSITEYMNSLEKPFYDNVAQFECIYDSDKYTTTRNIISTMDRRFDGINRSHSLRKLINTNKKIIVLKSLRSDIMTRLENHFKDEDLEFIRFTNRAYHYAETCALLNDVGCVFGEQYIKDNSVSTIKVKGNSLSKVDDKPCVIFSPHSPMYENTDLLGYAGWNNKFSTTIKEINANVDSNRMIRVGKTEFGMVSNKLDNSYHVVIMKDRKGLSEKIPTYSSLLKKCQNKKYYTSSGEMFSFDDITRTSYVVIMDHVEAKIMSEILSHYTLKTQYIFVQSENEAFVFHVCGKAYNVDDGYLIMGNAFGFGKEIDNNTYFNSIKKVHNIIMKLPDDLKEILKICLKDDPDNFNRSSETLLRYADKK